MAVGENVTPIAQVSPAPMLGLQPLLATAKSPLAEIGENDRTEVRWLVRMTVLAVLVVPRNWPANDRLVGEGVT